MSEISWIHCRFYWDRLPGTIYDSVWMIFGNKKHGVSPARNLNSSSICSRQVATFLDNARLFVKFYRHLQTRVVLLLSAFLWGQCQTMNYFYWADLEVVWSLHCSSKGTLKTARTRLELNMFRTRHISNLKNECGMHRHALLHKALPS